MKIIESSQLNFKSLLLFVFIILTILYDNTTHTIYVTISFIFLFLFNFSAIKYLTHKESLFYLVFSIWCFLSLLWSSNPTGGLTRATTCIILYVVILVLLCYAEKFNSAFVDSLLFAYLIGSLILIGSIAYALQDVRLLQMLAAVERLDTDILNLNMLGKYFAIGSIISVHFLINKKNLIYIIPLIIFVLFVLLTKSKSALFATFLGLMFYLYFYFRGKGKIIKFWKILVLVFLGFYILSTLTIWGDAFIRLEDMFDYFISQRKGGDYSTEMRELFIRKGLESIPESPIWGHGIGSVADVMRRMIDSTMTTEDAYFHNNYVQLWSELGIVGVLLFYIPIIKIVKKLYKCKYDKNAVVLLSIMLIFLFDDMNNTTYYHKLYFIFIGICLFYLKTKHI